MQPDPQVIEELVHRIVEVAHPLRIILFGSAARGEMRPDSDISTPVPMPGRRGDDKTRAEQYWQQTPKTSFSEFSKLQRLK